MNSKEILKKIADEKNFIGADSIINKILTDATLEAEKGNYSMYIDKYFNGCSHNVKYEIVKILESEPYNFYIERYSDTIEQKIYIILKWL